MPSWEASWTARREGLQGSARPWGLFAGWWGPFAERGLAGGQDLGLVILQHRGQRWRLARGRSRSWMGVDHDSQDEAGAWAWVLGEESLGGWDSVQKLEGGARGRTRFWDPELPVLRPAGSLALGVVEPGMRRPLVAIQQIAVRPTACSLPCPSSLS